jgi:hypothetical protein
MSMKHRIESRCNATPVADHPIDSGHAHAAEQRELRLTPASALELSPEQLTGRGDTFRGQAAQTSNDNAFITLT